MYALPINVTVSFSGDLDRLESDTGDSIWGKGENLKSSHQTSTC